ncbi:MAG TPA: serine hydrolase, partial [Herpetosiphonaceae bacterium]
PPTPAPWRFPRNTRIGGVNVGALTEDQARQVLERESAALFQPLLLVAGGQVTVVKPAEIGLRLPIEEQLAEARRQSDGQGGSGGDPIQIAFKIVYDSTLLRQQIAALAPSLALTPALGFDDAAQTFVLTPGRSLDITRSLALAEERLAVAGDSRRVELITAPVTGSLRASSEQIIAALAAREEEWGGLVGVAVYDFTTGETINYHGDTVFSGASVLKIPILLQSYISREEFSANQQIAIDLMMRISDNDSANELLAMIGDGDGLEGVQQMNATLREVLGLEYTAMAAPFESITYLSEFEGIEIRKRGIEGPSPHTDADPYVRATPAEMTRLLVAVAECARGGGPLLDMPGTKLTPARCDELLEVMQRNEDANKIVAGVPPGTFVAHKSGWIDDARADAGLVRAADGSEYVISMWLWEETDYILTEVSDPLLGDLSRIVYSGLHPADAETSEGAASR